MPVISLSLIVYICLCNALTDKRLKQAIATTGTERVSEVYAACGCRAQCGQCVQTVLRLVRDYAGQAKIDFPQTDFQNAH